MSLRRGCCWPARLAWLGVLAPVVAAQEPPAERAAIEAFRRAWHAWSEPGADLELCKNSVGVLDAYDSAAVARTLVAVHDKLSAHIAELDQGRLEIGRELATVLAADDPSRGRGRPTQVKARELRQQWFAARPQLDQLRPLAVSLRERIGRLQSAPATRWLADQVLAARRAPLRLRLAVVEGLAMRGADAVRLLGGVLGRCRDPEPLVAALVGLRRAGPDAAPLAADVEALLLHDNGAVREAAARALAAIAVPSSIEPMIALLEREQGQARERVGAALEILTRQQLGTIAASWRVWFVEQRGAIEAGGLKLGGGAPREASVAPGGSSYMGLPQDGRSIVYVLDASRSMREAVDFVVPDSTSANGAGTTRFSACQGELIRALATLTAEKTFNVIAFHEAALRFRETPVPATAKNIAQAQSWVRELQMGSMTNAHDALQDALATLAVDPGQRAVGDGVDTIFLLTDGRPTLGARGDGTADTAAAIVAAMADWDPLQRVTIHCIGVGKGLARGFLQEVAQAGGGRTRFY